MSSKHMVLVEGATFYAYHGATPEQESQGQRFIIDASVTVDSTKACMEDDITGQLNYTEVYEVMRDVCTKERFKLMQTLALRIIEVLRERYPTVSEASVSARKALCPWYRFARTPGGGGIINDEGGCGVTIRRIFD